MPATTTRRKMMRPIEVAEIYGVHPDKVRKWIERGELRAFNAAVLRDGAKPRYLIDPDDLKAFEESRRPTPPAPAAKRRRRQLEPSEIEFYPK